MRQPAAAADRRRANEVPEWDTLKRDYVPRRLLESCGIVSAVAESHRKTWAGQVADYVGELQIRRKRPFMHCPGQGSNLHSL